MMAEAALQTSGDLQAVKLAGAIRTAHLAKIDQMRRMLTDRDAGEKTHENCAGIDPRRR